MKKAIAGNVISFSFIGLDALTFDVTSMSEANHTMAVIKGMGHRLGDMAANMKTEAERREAVLAGITHYANATEQNWSMRSERQPALIPQVLAYAEKTGKPYAEALVWFNTKMAELLDAVDTQA